MQARQLEAHMPASSFWYVSDPHKSFQDFEVCQPFPLCCFLAQWTDCLDPAITRSYLSLSMMLNFCLVTAGCEQSERCCTPAFAPHRKQSTQACQDPYKSTAQSGRVENHLRARFGQAWGSNPRRESWWHEYCCQQPRRS